MIFFGFAVGDRVMSGDTVGTVVNPGYEPSEEMFERRCVPVRWDSNEENGAISWIMSANLRKT